MDDEFLLLNPGPVPVRDDALEAMAEPMVSHRSAAFEAVYQRVQDGLTYVFERSAADGSRTARGGTSLVLNGTATLGMEAAIANLIGPEDEVVALVNGKFGRRFARIAARYAGTVTRVEAEWGSAIPIDAVETAVTDETALVTMVHNETSTGLQNPVWGVGRIAAEHDARFVVDGVTSIGGDVFHIGEWNVDIAITDAQKALETPPGISAVYVTDEIESQLDGDSAPFYADLEWHLRKAEQHQTPFTSAIPLFRAMAEAVESIKQEGMADRIQRHHEQARAFRDGFTGMGLELFGQPADTTVRSNTVTAVKLPSAIRGSPAGFFDAVAERNVSISGGQAHLGGDIFRVSNMGSLAPEQIVRGVRVVGEAMRDVGVELDVATGVEAAEARLE